MLSRPEEERPRPQVVKARPRPQVIRAGPRTRPQVIRPEPSRPRPRQELFDLKARARPKPQKRSNNATVQAFKL